MDYQKRCGNDLEFVDEFLQNFMKVLVKEASDDFWKILKYGSTDALTNPSYTISVADKYAMIKQGNKDAQGNIITKIRRLKFNDDISTVAHSEIRIFDGAWRVPTFGSYEMTYGIEIISHNDIICLQGGKTTLNVLRNEIYRLFNGRYIDKNVGRLHNEGTTGTITVFNSSFQGYQMSLRGASS